MAPEDASEGWQKARSLTGENELGSALSGGSDAQGYKLAAQLSVGSKLGRVDSGRVHMGSTVSCMQAASAGVEDDRVAGVQPFSLPDRELKVHTSAS